MTTLALKEMGKFLWEGNLKSGMDSLPLSLQRISVKQHFFYKRLSISNTFKRIYFGLGYDFGRRESRHHPSVRRLIIFSVLQKS